MRVFSFSTLTMMMTVSVLMLSGCAATKPTYKANGTPNIVVNEKGVPNYYKVRSGDSVSKIAARYGLNYRVVGRLNRLDSKYTIYAGQWLKLWEGEGKSTNPSNKSPTTRPTSPQPSTPPVNVNNQFQYPTKNKIIRQFGANSSAGMWFSGHAGDPVYASQAGTVIYTGNGLPEFGNLVMIRHTEELITAYAHNSRIIVKEGTYVQKGQQIAAMGQTGNTDKVALQFQVRNNGIPVDPRPLLGGR